MKAKLGDQELQLLQYIAEHGAATVGEMAAAFGEPRGLARSTVLTVMERLRKKGYLVRRRVNGVFHYGSRSDSDELLQGAVGRFVEKTLSGSVSPFVAWMSQRSEVTPTELDELEQLVAKLRADRREP